MLSKFNIYPIIKSYFRSFKKYRQNSYAKASLLLLILLPAIVASAFIFFGKVITKDMSGLLVGLYSIFAGLFFSLQIFIFDSISKIV